MAPRLTIWKWCLLTASGRYVWTGHGIAPLADSLPADTALFPTEAAARQEADRASDPLAWRRGHHRPLFPSPLKIRG